MTPNIDIRKLFRGSGYLMVESAHDTTNIVCARGHIYADGVFLVASLTAGSPAQCRSLHKLGDVVMDGDFGELSIRFPYSPERFREVARIMRPKQAEIHKPVVAKRLVFQPGFGASILQTRSDASMV